MIKDIKYKLDSEIRERPSGQPQAAVLIGLLNYNHLRDNPEIIYTQRSKSMSTHSGEVSFPGGKVEPNDKDLSHTALREANEEINLNSKDASLLGQMNYLISRHKIEVNPMVYEINAEQEFRANSEIADIFTVPLNYLLDLKNIKKERIDRHGSTWMVPTWEFNHQKIWGLTAMITVNFLNLCFDANIIIDEADSV